MSVYHIHVDAAEISGKFEEYLAHAGFVRNDFADLPQGTDSFAAPNHLTLKLYDSAEFRKTFEAVEAEAKTTSGITGYLEGEFISVDREVAYAPYREKVEVPFRVSNQPIAKGTFRETEIHITLDLNRSDPRLLSALSEMGFFSALMYKAYGVAQIFTVQGSRSQIDQLLPSLFEYLETCGGAVNCSVKEERVARWWVSDVDVKLPPVIVAIDWAHSRGN